MSFGLGVLSLSRLLFWSGQSFDEPSLEVEGTVKALIKKSRENSREAC